jgi:hypothetical protein
VEGFMDNADSHRSFCEAFVVGRDVVEIRVFVFRGLRFIGGEVIKDFVEINGCITLYTSLLIGSGLT